MENLERQKPKQDNFFLNISLNVIIPSVIMTKFSGEEYLGQVWGLVIALAFPLIYGIFDLVSKRKFNFFSILGLVSIFMTGGIGLMSLDKKWMVVKETGIPLIMGIVVLASQKTRWPLVPTFLNQIIDLDKVKEEFTKKNLDRYFAKILSLSSYLLGTTFFISAALNYYLAIEILKGQPGTVEFNESLGKMTALSFPVITVPMVIMVSIILTYLLTSIKKEVDLEIEDIIRK